MRTYKYSSRRRDKRYIEDLGSSFEKIETCLFMCKRWPNRHRRTTYIFRNVTIHVKYITVVLYFRFRKVSSASFDIAPILNVKKTMTVVLFYAWNYFRAVFFSIASPRVASSKQLYCMENYDRNRSPRHCESSPESTNLEHSIINIGGS